MTPLSRSGKVFCIIYAIVGIPMTLVLLSALVERLLVPTVWLLQWLNSHLGRLYQPFNIRLLHLFIIGTITNSHFHNTAFSSYIVKSSLYSLFDTISLYKQETINVYLYLQYLFLSRCSCCYQPPSSHI